MTYRCVLTVRVQGAELAVPKYSEINYVNKKSCLATIPYYVEEATEEFAAAFGHRCFEIVGKAEGSHG
jgi:hypothetical protein